MNKKKKIILIVCGLVLVLLLLALALLGEPKNEASVPTEPAVTEPAATEPTEAVIPDIAVETPYGTLYFPGQWTDRVRTEVTRTEVLTAAFYWKTYDGREVRLFDVIFGEAEMGILGTVKTESGEICPVGLQLYEAESQEVTIEKDVYEFNAAQEEINYLIERLPMDDREQHIQPNESTVVVQNQRPAAYADVLLETPCGTLAYPGELAGKLHVELQKEEPYAVTFCWNNGTKLVKLFEIAFGGEEDTRIGYLVKTGHPVHLTVFDLSLEELTREEMDTALGLQEALNDVLARLKVQSQPVEEISCSAYETPYGTLYYPDEYAQYLEVTVHEEKGCRVEFCFLREDGEQIALFDVCFGDSEGTPVGRYTGQDGVSVPVYLVSYAVAENCFRDDQERDLYYTMAEGVNFLLEKYAETEAFEFN